MSLAPRMTMRDHLRPEDRQCPYCEQRVGEYYADAHLDRCRARAIARLAPSMYSDTTLQRSASAVPAEPPRETAAQALDRMRARTEAWTRIASGGDA